MATAGVPWSDVDLDEGSLKIRTALQRVNGELTLTAPKTRRSERPVPLPAVCVDALRRHRERQAEEREAAREQGGGRKPAWSSPSGGGPRSSPGTPEPEPVLLPDP
ncbi:hypothetical protein GCM10010320_03240 [Streptomyces caelestis]|nr:hypothetical protein GCM10010320_03240 [Streptomyces caelestis]